MEQNLYPLLSHHHDLKPTDRERQVTELNRVRKTRLRDYQKVIKQDVEAIFFVSYFRRCENLLDDKRFSFVRRLNKHVRLILNVDG